MSKILSNQRQVDNRGTALFSSYCANHNPQIVWTDLANSNEIGIDGEVELFDENGKLLLRSLKFNLNQLKEIKVI